MSVLIFCLWGRSIKISSCNVDLFIFLCTSVSCAYIFWSSVINYICILDCFLLMKLSLFHYEDLYPWSYFSVLKSTFYDISFNSVSIVYLFHIFIYNLFYFIFEVCLISTIVGSCFLIQCDNLYSLKLCTLNVIIDMVRFRSIILPFIFYLSHLQFVPSFLFFCLLLWINWCFYDSTFISFVDLLAIILCFVISIFLEFIAHTSTYQAYLQVTVYKFTKEAFNSIPLFSLPEICAGFSKLAFLYML